MKKIDKEEKCYTYISYSKITLEHHSFIQEYKDGDGVCSKCGVVVDGEVLPNIIKNDQT